MRLLVRKLSSPVCLFTAVVVVCMLIFVLCLVVCLLGFVCFVNFGLAVCLCSCLFVFPTIGYYCSTA